MPAPTVYIAIARLLRPQGRRGELLADPLTDLPEIFTAGRRVWCVPTGTQSASDSDALTLEASWPPTGRNAGRIVLKLSGVDSISAAEDLSGRDLLLEESELPARDPDTFLVRDLLGCTLFNNDVAVGEVVDLEFPMTPDGRQRLEDAAPLLLVQLATSSEPGQASEASVAEEPVMVPFIKAWLQSVDLAERSIRMTLPEGLFSTADARDGGPDEHPDAESLSASS